jgi:REP element-mobilizing transposase RayT
LGRRRCEDQIVIQRRTPRLKDWDYSTPGAYFITVVTCLRQPLFGSIDGEGVMTRSHLGTIAEAEWWRALSLVPNVESPAFVLMPNHVHGILCLNLNPDGDNRASGLTRFVGRYKAAVSRKAGRAIWQRSFYDRIIRDEREMEALWDYMESNPGKWAEDHENPAAPAKGGTCPAPTPPWRAGRPRYVATAW